MTAARFLVTAVLIWAICAVGWLLVALAFAVSVAALDNGAILARFPGAVYPQLPLFTTGCLAYLEIGPFRLRASSSERMRQLIVGNRELRLGGPAEPELVQGAEQILGVSLSPSYREFLLDFGELRGPSLRFLGLGPKTDLDHPTPDDFVGATLAGRSGSGLSLGYVACAVEQDGRLACIDTNTAKDGEGPVVVWDSATRALSRVAATSFAEYLAGRLA